MSKEKMMRATRESLLARAQKREENKTQYREYACELTGEVIIIKMLPLNRICEILDMREGDGVVAGLSLQKQIAYESVPLFKEKEVQEAFGCAEPYDVVTAYFDDNIEELSKFSEFILSLYGLADIEESVKN